MLNFACSSLGYMIFRLINFFYFYKGNLELVSRRAKLFGYNLPILTAEEDESLAQLKSNIYDKLFLEINFKSIK